MCVFGPEKLPGLSRNGPLGRIKLKPTAKPRKRKEARRPRRHFPILDLVEEGPLNFTSIFSKTGNEIGDAKRQTYQACPSFKGLGLLNYRIHGTFSRYIRWGGSVARQSLLTSHRATKPRLKSHKASCRAPKILPFSFFNMLTSTDQPSSH